MRAWLLLTHGLWCPGSCPRCHLPDAQRAVPAPPAPAAAGRGAMARLTDGLFGNPWPDFVRTLPEGVEVPHAPPDVPLSTLRLPGLWPERSSFSPRPDIGGIQAADKRGGRGSQAGGATRIYWQGQRAFSKPEAAGLSSLQHAGSDRPMIKADLRRKGHDVFHKLLSMRHVEILVLLSGTD